jgi:hypothetical protein
MPNFKPYDYNQSSMIVINYQDQLQPGTFEHAIHYLVDKKMDISIFFPKLLGDNYLVRSKLLYLVTVMPGKKPNLFWAACRPTLKMCLGVYSKMAHNK